MKRLPRVICMALCGFLMCSGCEGDDEGDDDALALTAADNGRTVQLAAGQGLRVSLAENATTGYEWEVDACDAAVLQYLGESFSSDASAPGREGAGGTVTLSFRAVGHGETRLRLVKRHTQELGFATDGPAIETFSVAVEVSE